MPGLKQIEIQQSTKELNAMQKGASLSVQKRLSFLIAIKQGKLSSVSKRAMSAAMGIDANSVTNWKRLYEQKGIAGIVSDGRIGFKPSVVTPEEHQAIEEKLNDPRNGIRGYKELLEWVRTALGKDMKYITLVKYTSRHFGAKIKVARKSHAKKDEEAVAIFKKTLDKPVLA